MSINSLRSTSVFCFSFCLISVLLLLTISRVNGQNDPQQQQPNSKINSININNKSVTPASDTVVIKKKYSNLNGKYETQSAGTSTTNVGLYPGQKKSKYNYELC